MKPSLHGLWPALLLAVSCVAWADSAVWVAEKDGERVILGGTVHVLRAGDYPLPTEFEAAYRSADAVYLETDMAAVTSGDLGGEMRSRMMLRAGRTLQGVLSKEAYAELREYCDARGIPLEILQHFKPAMVVLTLMGIELQRLGIATEGVDAFFYRRARQDGKRVGQLETVESQLDYLAAMGEGRESSFVRHSLIDLDDTGELLDDMIAAWRAGDLEALTGLYVTELKEDFPDLYRDLLVARNRDWLPLIERMFNEPGTEFVLVGAAHLVGEDGLLRQLARRGYRIDSY